MTQIVRNNGWTFDLEARTMVWPGVDDTVKPIPVVTTEGMFYFGVGYVEGQSTTRMIGDAFRKAWAEAAPDRKVKDAPKSCIPDPDSAEYKAAVLEAHKAQWAKLVEGYEVGARAGSDPYATELDGLARPWLQTFAEGRGWYSLPGKNKVARDEDPYADPRGRYATFGDALAAFTVATTDSSAFALGKPGKDAKGRDVMVPWPITTKKGVSIADLLAHEATRRVEAAKDKAAKVRVVSTAAEDAPEADF